MKTFRRAGPAFVVTAAILWGIIGIFTRTLNTFGFDAVQISFVRAFFTFVFCLSYCLIFNRRALRIDIRDIWLFAGNGILSIAAFNTCYFYTIQSSTLALASILLYTAPCFVILLSRIFFKEKITPKILTALVLSFLGCILTTGGFGSGVTATALITGLTSGFCYALYSIFSKVILKKYTVTTLILYTFFFAAIALSFVSAPLSIFTALKIPDVLLYALGIALFCTLLPYVLYSAGLKRLSPGRASVLAFVEVLTATLTGLFLYHEPLTLPSALGIILIFVSIVLLSRNENK